MEQVIQTRDAAQSVMNAIEYLAATGVVDGDIVDGLRDAGQLLLILSAAGVDGAERAV